MKEIEGCHGYWVSTDGFVWTTKSGVLQPMARKLRKDGYLQVELWVEGRRISKRVHRLVAEAFLPEIVGKPEVNHIDRNRANCALANLEWVSRSENAAHSYRGSASGRRRTASRCKLTPDEVKYIRAADVSIPHKVLAAEFGVHKRTIARIRTRESWDFL